MGYQAPIEFSDGHAATWKGEHRPEFVNLEGIFRQVIELDVPALEPGLASAGEAWRKALPDDVHIIRMLSPNAVHVHASRAPLVKDMVIKLMLPRPDTGWRRLTQRLDRSRSHRAHLWGHRLRALGIDTPRPLGYIERKDTPARYPSFAVTEYVLAPTLVELRDTGMQMLGVRGPGAALIEKRALIERIATLMRKMHAHGVFHADLHAGNILVTPEAVLLIDLESMRRFAVPHRASVKNLIRLNRAFLDTRIITRTDRMRFLRAYLRHQPDRPNRLRVLWARVLAETELKLNELGEAFQ
jgi:tRNA A-37 threonylcarbamoyl transferase component Bud32